MKKTLLIMLLIFTSISYADLMDKQIIPDAVGGVWIYDDWNDVLKHCDLEYKEDSDITCTDWEKIENDGELES